MSRDVPHTAKDCLARAIQNAEQAERWMHMAMDNTLKVPPAEVDSGAVIKSSCDVALAWASVGMLAHDIERASEVRACTE